MKNNLVAINELPPDGKDFVLNDQGAWQEPIEEFDMDCQIIVPLNMRLHVQRADEGVLLRGTLKGGVSLPCDRCLEDTQYPIDSKIEEYEEIPPEKRKSKEPEEEGYIVYEKHVPMLDLNRVAWEQFMMSLPIVPLCNKDCKGLCPDCGKNLNEGECECLKETGDPRLAILKDVKIGEKKDD